MSFAPKQFIRSVDFLSTENAINTSTGCVNIYGGMSVSKDSYLTNMIVVGNTTINNLNITGTLISSTGNSLVSSQWVNSGANGIYFGTSSNTLVGIGTTTPGFTLDISGGSRITGGLTVGNLNVNTGATITNILNTTICTGTIITTNITATNIYVTSGNITAQNGQFLANLNDTVSAPGFSWTGDNNTGIYRPAGDAMGFITNSSERMRITSSGNVGIGTTSPGTTLDISGTARITTSLTTGSVFSTNQTTTNIVGTNITSSNLRVSGTINSGDITVGNINFIGNLFQNGSAYLGSQWTTTTGNTLTYTSGNVNISNVFTSNTITTSSLLSTNATITNMNSSTNTLGTLNATGITTSSLLATSASIGNISAGSINLSGNMNVAGTLTVVNVTTTNLMMSNGNAILNLVTSGSILNTGTITSGPVVLRTPNNFDGRALTISTLTAGNAYNLTLNAVNNTNNNVYWSLGQNTLSSTYANMLTFYGGNVGIGTTSPGNNLDVSGTARITTSLTTGSLFSTNQTTTNIVGTNSTFGGLTSTGLVYLLSTAGNIASTSNNYSITSGSVNITGDIVISGNQLFYTTTGVGSPVMNGRGNGSKIVLYPETGVGLGDYSIGVESGYMWFQVPNINYAGYKFYQGTTTSLIITPAGNVGIGATSPSRLLSLSGPSSNIVNGPHIWINTSDSPVNPVFQQLNWTADNVSLNFDMYYDGAFRNSGSSTAWQIYKNNSQLRFMLQNGTAGSSNGQYNAMVLGSTGNVGIGNPFTPAYILDVAGTTRITNTTATSMGTLIVAGPNSSAPATATSGQLVSFYGGGGAASISNIDFSTFLPTSAAMSLPSVRFSMKDLGANNSDFNILTKNSGSTGTMASRIFIDGSGNVGINTSEPSSRLHVVMGDATSAGSTQLWDSTYAVFGQSNNTGGAVGIGYNSASGGCLVSLSPNVGWRPLLYRSLNHQFIVGGTTGTPPSMVINTAGNVGIGTTAPSALLYINSASASYNRGNSLYIKTQQSGIVLDSTQSTNGRSWNVWSTISSDTPGAGSFAIFDSTASAYRILINTSGNVGIGLTNPAFTLDINGTLRTTTAIGSNGSALITGTDAFGHSLYIASSTGTQKRIGFNHNGTAGNIFSYDYTSGTGGPQPLVLQSPGGNVGINTSTPLTKLHVEDGSVFIGDAASGFSTTVPSANTGTTTANGYRLFFDNSFNGVAGTGVAANKIVIHNNNYTCGFGMESDALTYHSGNLHRFYCGATTGYGSQALSIGATQTVVITNTDGEGGFRTVNSNSGSSAFGMFRIGNNVGDLVMFLNSSTRTIDGGANTCTIRNDVGALRLQGAGATNTIFLPGSSTNVGINTTSPSYTLQVAGDIYASGDVISFSDARLKTDISTINNALDKVSSMRGVYYTNLNTQNRETGVIAQEMSEILPEVVADKGEYLGVAYGNIVGVLIEAIKELKARVVELENR